MHRVLVVIAIAMFLAACAEPASTAPAAAPAAAFAPAAPAAREPATAVAAQAEGEALVDQTIDKVLGDHVAYRVVIDAFRKAVVTKDAAAVSQLVDYPFTASIGGKRTKIADARAFVAQYDKIVTPAIARTIGEQRYDSLFVNAKGVMFGRGEAWINGVCKDGAPCQTVDVRVVAIQPTEP